MRRADKDKGDLCQLQGLIRTSETVPERGLSAGLRIRRALKRRLGVRLQKSVRRVQGRILDFFERFQGEKKAAEHAPDTGPSQRLEAGDLVRVRSLEEIQSTLDRWGKLKGCGFIHEMAAYCGTTQRVLKRVERFLDEKDYRLKKASGIVLLEGAICSGTGATGRCDRACFFFWREEWLQKLGGLTGPKD